MTAPLTILPTELLEAFRSQVADNVESSFASLHESALSMATFSFYTSVAAVFSSKIEGEDIELDSYLKHKRLGVHFRADYTRKTDDLYDAYLFAQQTPLSAATLNQAHSILSRHLLQAPKRGRFRTGNMFVLTPDGRIEYVAAAPAAVKPAMGKLDADLATLLEAELTFQEVLYFAAMLHLVLVKIHPYEDGNGRTARLLEKWFVAQKLGPKAWFIRSEEAYHARHQTYFANLRRLGLDYAELDYSQALPFLLMLPQSITPQE